MRPERLLDAAATAFIANTSTRADLPIDVLALLRALGAEVRTRDATKRGPSAEWLSEDGRDVVVLYRSPAAPAWLLARERFALAHELAHILVARSIEWRPSSSSEYYYLEEACQEIASEVLIPSRVLPGDTDKLRPAALLAIIRRLQSLCAVSFEAAARRVLAESRACMLALAVEDLNSRGQPVLRAVWTAGAHRMFSLQRGSHIKSESPWAQLLARESGVSPVESVTTAGVEWALVRSRRDSCRYLLWGRILDTRVAESAERGSSDHVEREGSLQAARQLEFYPAPTS